MTSPLPWLQKNYMIYSPHISQSYQLILITYLIFNPDSYQDTKTIKSLKARLKLHNYRLLNQARFNFDPELKQKIRIYGYGSYLINLRKICKKLLTLYSFIWLNILNTNNFCSWMLKKSSKKLKTTKINKLNKLKMRSNKIKKDKDKYENKLSKRFKSDFLKYKLRKYATI